MATTTVRKEPPTEAEQENRKVNREVRKKMKAANEEKIEEQCRNIEKGMMSGNSKEACGNILTEWNWLLTPRQPRRSYQGDPDGKHNYSKPVD